MGGDTVSPEEAAGWLTAWQREQLQATRGSLRPWQRGPSAARPARPDHLRIGRQLFTRVHQLRGVRDDSGDWHDEPSTVEDIRWRSRQEVWASAPPFLRRPVWSSISTSGIEGSPCPLPPPQSGG